MTARFRARPEGYWTAVLGSIRGGGPRVEAEIDEMPHWLRDALSQLYRDRESHVPVLDLALDSLVDTAEGPTSGLRRMIFAGDDDVVVEVDAHGRQSLLLDVRTEPPGGVTVEVRGLTSGGRLRTRRRGRSRLEGVAPGLTSLLVRWEHGEHAPVRTAWVVL